MGDVHSSPVGGLPKILKYPLGRAVGARLVELECVENDRRAETEAIKGEVGYEPAPCAGEKGAEVGPSTEVTDEVGVRSLWDIDVEALKCFKSIEPTCLNHRNV